MDKTYYLQKLSNDKKKYSVQLPNSKRHIKFGDSNYEDYTIHKDDVRKENYVDRHKNDKLNDLSKAGFWAMELLWNKKTIRQSIKDIEKKKNIKIVYSS